MSRHRLDLVSLAAMVAAAVALFMLVVYLGIMRQEAHSAAAWFVAALVLGVVAAGYGTSPAFPYRRSALILAGLVLAAIGVVAIFSIGLPILLAGALCLFAGARSPPHSPGAPST